MTKYLLICFFGVLSLMGQAQVAMPHVSLFRKSPNLDLKQSVVPDVLLGSDNFARSSVLWSPPTIIPPVYCYQKLGIFCKLEVQVNRQTRLPIKMRLGDVDQEARDHATQRTNEWLTEQQKQIGN